MTQKVGEIEFSVDVDAKGVATASTRVQDDLKDVEQSFARADSSAKKFSQTSNKTGGALGGLGKNAGQAGIQIQQFVGQIQGGQSALLALSQQGTDLGIVLGRAGLGAAVGIGATALSFLIPALTGAGEETESLKDRIKELGDEITLTANQIKFLGSENSKAADELSQSNLDLAEKLKKAREELEKMQSAGTGIDTGQFAVPRSAEENQRRYAEAIKETEDRIQALTTEIDTNNQTIAKLAGETASLGKNTEEASSKSQSYTASLQAQVIALEGGAQAAEVYAAAQQAVSNGTEEQLPKIIELINRKYELKAAEEAATQAANQQIQAQKNYSAVLDDIFAKEEARKAQEAAKKERIAGNLESLRESLMSEQQLRAEAFNLENEQLREALEAKQITQDEFDELTRQKAKQHADELVAIEQERAAKEKAIEDQKNRAKLAALGGIFSNLSSLMNTESRKLFERNS